MCSRIAASILRGALPRTSEGDRVAEELIVRDEESYEERAVELALDLAKTLARSPVSGQARLLKMRQLLFESRWTSALFDTRRWGDEIELAYGEAWRRWVWGIGGDIWL